MAKKSAIESWKAPAKYKTRFHNRCRLCGRPRGYMRQFGMWESTEAVAPIGPRVSATALWMAKEWGIAPLASALDAMVNEHYEPTWDRARGEFTWGFELHEPHPRGQYNGTSSIRMIYVTTDNAAPTFNISL